MRGLPRGQLKAEDTAVVNEIGLNSGVARCIAKKGGTQTGGGGLRDSDGDGEGGRVDLEYADRKIQLVTQCLGLENK